MNLEWVILNPAAPFAVVATGMGLCLYLFLSLKRDLRASEQRCRKMLAVLEADLQGRWNELSQISRPPGPSPAATFGAECDPSKPGYADGPPG